MGQYYKTVIQKGKEPMCLNQQTSGEDYNGLKLMEHSWWRNPFVMCVCRVIYNDPAKVTWVGDYSEDLVPKDIYNMVWGKDANTTPLDPATVPALDITGKYLVNHSKKEYIDCDRYFESALDDDGWCIHPLPILTCAGNGLGGGDYHGRDMQFVGSWSGDLVSVEDKGDKIIDKYNEIQPVFLERSA